MKKLCPKQLILSCLFLISSVCVEYRLKATRDLSIADIQEIAVLNESSMAVRSSSAVYILSIHDYQVKAETYHLQSSQAKLSRHGVGILDQEGSSLTFQIFSQQNYTFIDQDIVSNLIITKDYVLLAKQASQPTLKKLFFDPVSYQTITLPPIEGWSLYAESANLANLGNGDFAYLHDTNLLILNNESLAISQILEVGQSHNVYTAIYSYQDSKTNESTCFIGGGIFSLAMSQLKKDKESGKYGLKLKFITPSSFPYDFGFFQTSPSKATLLQFGSIQYWANFNSIIERRDDVNRKLKENVAISYDQSILVAKNKAGSYQFYRFGDDYQLTLIQSIEINDNNLKKAAFTSDDSLLFVSTNRYNIIKVDVKTGRVTEIIDQGYTNNQADFNLFHSKYNRFVTLTFRNGYFYLQLRTMSDLKLIDEFPLRFNFTIYEYKFVATIQWDLTFGLGVHLPTDIRYNSKLFLFRIEEDKIVNLNISAETNYTNLLACDKYAITYDTIYNGNIEVLFYSNLSKVFTLDLNSTSVNIVKSEKNVLIVNSYGRDFVYNFELANPVVGSFYRDSFQLKYYPPLSFIFPKRGVLYDLHSNSQREEVVVKVVYNISSPSAVTWNQIESSNAFHYPSYYIPSQESKSECNILFYVDYSYDSKESLLYRYSECSGESTTFSTSIDRYQNGINSQTYISSDNKYLIILANPFSINYLHLEIRAIDSLQRIILSKRVAYILQHLAYPLTSFHVDLINDNMLIIQSPEYITLYFLEPKLFAVDHQMAAITHYDVSHKNIAAFAGPSLQDDKTTRIVVLMLSSKEYIFQTMIEGAVEDVVLYGELLAVFSSTVLRVWDTSLKVLIFIKTVEESSKIEFRGARNLVIKGKKGEEVVILSKNANASGQESLTAAFDGSTISIYSEKGKLVSNFSLSSIGEKFVSVSLSPNEEIFAVTNSSRLYVWTPIRKISEPSSQSEPQSKSFVTQ